MRAEATRTLSAVAAPIAAGVMMTTMMTIVEVPVRAETTMMTMTAEVGQPPRAEIMTRTAVASAVASAVPSAVKSRAAMTDVEQSHLHLPLAHQPRPQVLVLLPQCQPPLQRHRALPRRLVQFLHLRPGRQLLRLQGCQHLRPVDLQDLLSHRSVTTKTTLLRSHVTPRHRLTRQLSCLQWTPKARQLTQHPRHLPPQLRRLLRGRCLTVSAQASLQPPSAKLCHPKKPPRSGLRSLQAAIS